MIYFEDLEVGSETDFGSYQVTRDEVLDFARKYDPQPFHLSDEAAACVVEEGFAAASASRVGTTADPVCSSARLCVSSTLPPRPAANASISARSRWLRRPTVGQRDTSK